MGLPFDDAVTKPCYGTTEPFSGVVEVPRSTTEDEFSIAPRRTKLAVVGIVALCFVMSLGGAPRTRSSAPGQGVPCMHHAQFSPTAEQIIASLGVH